ncbi:hypothetical protein LN042_16465 [Kitasatospora sp. RB6PN24]|uniref:hypothetical protein n=1 Tax=Kitasatospora humi TaxID=2893891 RepID=UPI001E53C664|nr:hypothetical protein [Kitasatospora humi]MCC9308655.1 hypothetical protein [Kitasatospora humi]
MADDTPRHLARFDRLARPARQAALARHARALAPDAYETLHAGLDSGDTQDRHTALFLAVVRRDLVRVGAALDDPLLRARALAAAGRLPVPDEILADFARTAPRAYRHALYRLLRRSRRHILADRLLPEVHRLHGGQEAARLLPSCTPALVDEWLPHLPVPEGVLRSLARTAPRPLTKYLLRQTGQPADGRLPVRLRDQLITGATRRDRDAGLAVLRGCPGLLPAEAVVDLLTEPAAVVAAVREHAVDLPVPVGELPERVCRALRALPVEELAVLARTCRPKAPAGPFRQPRPEPVLQLLEPAERHRVARELLAAHSHARPHGSLLLALDPQERAVVVRDYLAHRRSREQRLAATVRYLPLAEAEERLATLAGSHSRIMRCYGWSALLQCAALGGDAAEYARVLRRSERAWHDHPEVRELALIRAAETPEGFLAAVPDDVLRDAALTVLQARDSTARCLNATARWLARTIRQAAGSRALDRVAELLAVLVQVREHPRCTEPIKPLVRHLPFAGKVWARLRTDPRLRRPERLLGAAELLPCLQVVDHWSRQILNGEEALAVRARAARLLLRQRRTRERRVEEVVLAHPAFAEMDEVWSLLVRRRTDLIGPALTAHLQAAVPWAPALPEDASRTDRALHTALVAPLVHDEERTITLRTAAAAVLTDPTDLLEVIDRAPQPVAAAALLRLAAVGDPAKTLPVLLARLGGGVRGRAAARGLRRVLAHRPDGEAAALLRERLLTPGTPVGVGKELARALADLPPDVAARTAVAAWDHPDSHRDVRAALGELMVRLLDRPGVADRLGAWLGEPAVREVVLAARTGPLPGSAEAAWEEFLAAAAVHPDPDVAEDALDAVVRRGRTGEAAARAVAAQLLTLGQAERVWRKAALVFSLRPQEPVVQARWPEVVSRLVELATGSDGQRELARQRLAGLVGGGFDSPAPELLNALVEPLARAGLAGRAARAAQTVAVRALAAGDPALHLWDRCLDLAQGHPLRLAQVAEVSGLAWGDRPPAEATLAVLHHLRARATTAAAVLAVGLLRTVGGKESWPPHWREELAHWQRHPDPDVAEAALLAR